MNRAFIVCEVCEDWEQPLALDASEGLPDRGILTWRSASAPHVALFETRRAARAAITRTRHYNLAFDVDGVDARLCQIREARPIPTPVADNAG